MNMQFFFFLNRLIMARFRKKRSPSVFKRGSWGKGDYFCVLDSLVLDAGIRLLAVQELGCKAGQVWEENLTCL